jgi:hypothetical protein
MSNIEEVFLVVSITNGGVIKIVLPQAFCYFEILIPFIPKKILSKIFPNIGSKFIVQIPLDVEQLDNIPKKTYPYTIESEDSNWFILSSYKLFRDMLHSASQQYPVWLFYFFHLNIQTINGKIYKVKISKMLRQNILNTVKCQF